ncbi:quinolinate synthase NadA [Ignavibacteria bacterium CHB1]|jgi:quinolinate synthase|nr:MAG: quinolinate synthase NadA [Chlorobiota bacterium]KXK06225.1 MAG: Quinolinate synthase [Chlorobi bacterium OLB4]MBV6399262.1 Quinolinate synthase A [Ignavibacteria bacterium]MCC6884935.1 quinolinate synthase NadA [Ignavibacteriales bacterium]MCE7953534.1 quinolinate synthase NadA [Chlorobi bacterium CHB7]MDL1887576.1 quinolinate synthase NadA [Ignavibacteria bacterium CHB1]OQY78461.1 MAG: quinolinate synthase [Ignavibacteriales bacterium UTCHB1]RIK49277.1 MAG: quinolinate synthase [Ig
MLVETKSNQKTDIDYRSEVLRLKDEMNAVILAHYYQESEIQDLADFIGDSLQLSQQAEKTDADVIVFAGVHFMAETAKILNPHKPVLLPDLNAGCSLAEGCPAPLLQQFKDKYPDHILISYINCSAEVKAISDIICTSSNVEKIISQIPEDKPIMFAPDKNLGQYIMKKTGREMKLWMGSCFVHETFSGRKITHLKLEHPDAKLIAHPECEEVILKEAEFIGSTSSLLNHVKTDPAKKFIVATEPGIIYQMQKAAPDKTFIPAPPEASCACNECPYMKLNTLEKLYLCMRDRKPEIIMDEDLIVRAYKPIKRMLEMSK